MNKIKKLVICIDGLGYDLISKKATPFLYALKEKGDLLRLKTLFAFTGIEYSFFTGKTPKENEVWLEFCKKDNSLFKNPLLKILSVNKKIRTYFGAFLQLLKGRGYIAGLHNIPSRMLKYFDSSIDTGLWKLGFFENKSFVFYKWPFFVIKKDKKEKRKIVLKYETDSERFKRLIEKKGFEIYYTQLMEIDKTVHKYGKISEKTQEILEKTDKLLGKITEKFLKQNKDSEVIIWSDHGFADIKNYIDVKKILPKRKDYLYFIAGTTVSFWFENENIKKEIEKKISQIKLLKKLTPKIARKYNIPLKEKYGESIYFLEKGNYLFPNFYQKSENEKFKAMHGYPDNSEMDGFILLSSEQGKTGKKVKKNLKIKDIIRIL